MMVAGCSRGAEGTAPATSGGSTTIPRPWSDLGLPTSGLKSVSDKSNEHGFYADYSGVEAARLMELVSDRLRAAGYTPACSAFHDTVKGFANGASRLAVKVDSFPGVAALSIFDKQGKEPLLHGVCFGEYSAEKVYSR
jgi:hypothetical protein